MKRKGIPAVKRGERGGKRICEGAVKEGLHPAVLTSGGRSRKLYSDSRAETKAGKKSPDRRVGF